MASPEGPAARLAAFVAGDPTLRILRSIVGFDGMRKCLVGGVVRDLILGRPVDDLDFVFGPKGHFLVREIGKRLGRRPARLENKEGETWRILAGEGLTLDFAILGEGETLEANLAGRDFAANAIAFDLDAGALVDPLGGAADLDRRLFRALPGALAADPLRLLRAARFLAAFPGFAFAEAAPGDAAAAAARLGAIPGERVREELVKTLVASRPAAGLALLDGSGALVALFGDLAPAPFAGPDGAAAFEAATARFAATPEGFEPPDPFAPVASALVHRFLGPAFVARAGGGDAAPVGPFAAALERLRFSNREVALVARLAAAADDLAARAARSEALPEWRAVDLVDTLRGDARLVAALADLAGEAAGSAPLRAAAALLAETLRLGRGLDLPRLLDGRDLLAMGVDEGPAVGRILAFVRRRQLEGALSTRADAVALVAGRLAAGESFDV